jgi:tetratricopeptide (TPR) repeat protein
MLRFGFHVRHIVLSWAAACALATPVSADSRWMMIRTPTVTVIGDQSAGRLRDVANQIEQFRTVVGGLIANADRPLSLPTIVYVFGHRDEMRQYVPIYNGKPIELAGYFQGDLDANIIVLSVDGFERSAAVIYHEYTHMLLRNAVRATSTWLAEGLAEYYSSYELEPGGKVALIGRPAADHITLLRDSYMPLAELIAVDTSSPLYNEGSKRSIFYAQSWALTHYAMTQMRDGRAAINRYAIAIAEGQAPADAFRSAFGAAPAEFDKQLHTFVQQYRFNPMRFELKEQIGGATLGPPRTMTAGETSAWLGDLQRRMHRGGEGKGRIEAAAKSEPDSPIAATALGLLQISQERVDDGLASLRRAAGLAPEDFFVQFAAGVWPLRVESARPSEAIAAAIESLKRATALNPNSADAYGWLAYALQMSKAPLGEVRSAIDRAVQLAPGRIDYLMRWADVRIRLGDYAAAKGPLTQIAALKVDPAAAETARVRLQRLSESEAALAERDAARAAAQAAPADAPAAPAPPSGGSLGVPGSAADRPLDPNITLMLRKVGPGEDRATGLLTRIECGKNEVRFEVRSGDRTLSATAKRMEDVELTQFLDLKDFSVACGSRPQPETVVLTWRREEPPVQGRVGIAVALEFVPRGYVP